ncbi:CoA-transferase family III domain-containing protein [Trametes elegans]|nr:CoA-transferase family III domain-containing protein [Trametes elegans]
MSKFTPTRSNLPLAGVKVIEFAGLAPGPMAGMILADFGADVVRVDRPPRAAAAAGPAPDVLARGKRSIAVDPKTRSGHAVVCRLVERADVLIDPFRPGVMERLGLGPEVFLDESKGRNKRLVYARLVGFPRTGLHKDMAGHDLNYLALSGVLSMLPGEKKPEFPLNVLADFAGGGVMCAMGILLALFERQKSGLGQVVDNDMVSGVRYLSSFPLLLSQLPLPHFGKTRQTGLLDGGAPFYNVYACSDGGYMSVGCLEPQFFRTFLKRYFAALPPGFALEDGWRPAEADQHDTDAWPRMKTFLECGFALHPRDYWAKVFDGSDACAVPVLTVGEAAALAAKGSSTPEGAVPSPHPLLERTPSVAPLPDGGEWTLTRGEHTEEVLGELGVGEDERADLVREGALGDRPTAKL